MRHMQRSAVTSINEARQRATRMSRVVEAQRQMRAAAAERPAPRRSGRAWLNGVELGEPEPGLAHLVERYD